jgi:hypothetical protein
MLTAKVSGGAEQILFRAGGVSTLTKLGMQDLGRSVSPDSPLASTAINPEIGFSASSPLREARAAATVMDRGLE